MSNPDATLRWAADVLADKGIDPESEARAWHAVAVARLERGEPARARRAAHRGLALAESAKLHLVLAWIEQDIGNSRASVRHLDLAQPRLRGALLARARCLRGLNLCVAGEYEAAHRELSAAVAGSRRHDDRHWLANALNARGVVRSYLRRLASADRDLATAQELYAALGERERAATCVHNRGWVALRSGDVPLALRRFDEAVAGGLRPSARVEALIDRAYAMLAGRLVAEAAAVLTEAAVLLGGSGRSMRLAEALLALGQCAAQTGQRDVAIKAAERARELFRAQRRTGWLAAAESLALRLTIAPSSVTSARLVARRCVRYGFRVEAAELRLAAATVAGRPVARRLLGLVQAERSRGPARLRALGWLARARLAKNRAGVLTACQAGRRTGAAEVVDELMAAGLDALLETGDPGEVLHWIGQVPLEGVTERLGGGVFLNYLEHAGELLAVSVMDGRARLHRLGPVPGDIAMLRFALSSPGASAKAIADRLDALLLAPLRSVLGDRSAVVVPTPALHGMPWAALKTCAGRVFSVAPSVSAWLRAHQRAARLDDPVWVAGPGLRHADREVAGLHDRWGGRLFSSSESTVDAVLAAMDGAGLVHIAAHGRYRADAPTFSSVDLADGPLHAYDLDRLERPPAVLVLSACECALAPLLHRGTRALVASTLPVVDVAVGELVTRLHAGLRAGVGVAEALVRAQGECGDVGFVCVGAG